MRTKQKAPLCSKKVRLIQIGDLAFWELTGKIPFSGKTVTTFPRQQELHEHFQNCSICATWYKNAQRIFQAQLPKKEHCRD